MSRARKQGMLLTLIVVVTVLGVVVARLWPQRGPLDFGTAAEPSSIVGVHTRLTDEVEEWKIEQTLGLAQGMGANWIVELFPWAYIEPRPGQFDWGHSDMVVRHANAQGLTVVARLDYVPAWARPKESTPRYLAPDRYEEYARFVEEFARRYRGAVRYYQIWNEPNTSLEWGYRTVDPAGYVELLRFGYRAVKAGDPEAKVLGGALAPTLAQDDLALDDLIFLQRMYDAGVRGWFDILSVHAYGFKLPPDAPAAPDRLNFARVELVHEVMKRNGDGDKPILITEAGWNDHPRWTRAVRPSQRITYTLRAYEKAANDWPYVIGVCMWAFRLPTPARNYNDYYTFVDTEFRPKAIYEAVQRDHAKWVRQPGATASR